MNSSHPVGKTKLLLIEGQRVAREGLRMLLQQESWLDVAEARDGLESLAMLPQGGYGLVILDVFLPHEDGIRLLACIRRQYLSLPILVLTAQSDPATVRAALHAGANGFVTKYASRAKLLAAILSVSSGGFFLDSRVAAPIVAALRKHQAGPQETARHRSQTILRGIKQGTSNQALAESLNISLSTLKSHLRRLFAEYGVTNRHGLLLAYPDEGLSPVPL